MSWATDDAKSGVDHDLMGGTGRMRHAGLKWLPREQAENWESWHARLNRSILYNGLSRTVHALDFVPQTPPQAKAALIGLWPSKWRRLSWMRGLRQHPEMMWPNFEDIPHIELITPPQKRAPKG